MEPSLENTSEAADAVLEKPDCTREKVPEGAESSAAVRYDEEHTVGIKEAQMSTGSRTYSDVDRSQSQQGTLNC